MRKSVLFRRAARWPKAAGENSGKRPRLPPPILLIAPAKAPNSWAPRRPLNWTSRDGREGVSRMTHTIVIGAGIAGLATAWRLSARGVGRVTVFEREPLAFSHSSARNAAIFRPLEENAATVRLVAREAELLTELPASAPLIQRSGLCLTASAGPALNRLLEVAQERAVPHEHLTGTAFYERCPAVRAGRVTQGIWLPDGGVLDIHALSELLRLELRKAGVATRTSAEVRRVLAPAGKVNGVELASGERLEADHVVIAAGAWAEGLGASVGAPLRLTPHRRHLALLMPAGEQRIPASHPVVWNVETGLYFRPESGGILACPGDHEAALPGLPLVNQAVLATLAQQLPLEAPLFETYAVARPWACLRTMSDSKETVLGPDPRVAGLYWLAGLGGHGMSAGLGAADLLATVLLGQPLAAWATPLLVATHLGRRSVHEPIGIAGGP